MKNKKNAKILSAIVPCSKGTLEQGTIAFDVKIEWYTFGLKSTKISSMEENPNPNIIIYNTADGKASVRLYAKDGTVWMNQNQLAELFATSKPNISMHISNILEEKELDVNSVVKDYLTTATDGAKYG